MPVQQISLEEAQRRLGELKALLEKLAGESATSRDELVESVSAVLVKAEASRGLRKQFENLRAEALYLRILHNLPGEAPEAPESGLDDCEGIWKEVRSALHPIRPDTLWLEAIREAEQSKTSRAALTAEEREELERRLHDTVCPICVNFALDGSCTLHSFETCPIDIYLNRLVTMIEQLGHRPWMEDYFERMYRDICPGCSGRIDKDYCPPRDEGDCALYSYLPTIVRTVETYLKEKNRKGA